MTRFILMFAASLAASPCVIVSIPSDASVVTISCPGFGPGVSITYRQFTPMEWATTLKPDSVKSDTLVGNKGLSK